MVKQTLSVTVDVAIIERLKNMIATSKFRNMSHALEYLVEKGIELERREQNKEKDEDEL